MPRKLPDKCVIVATVHIRPPNEKGGVNITRGQLEVIDGFAERWGYSREQALDHLLKGAIIEHARYA